MVVPLKYKLILVYLLIPVSMLWSQDKGTEVDMIESRVVVQSSPEEVWSILTDFTGIGDFHVLYEESSAVSDQAEKVGVGLERIGLIPNGNFNVILKERITEFVDGSHYTYEVTDWENIALGNMKVTYGVSINESGETILYSRTHFEMSNGILTSLYRSRFQKNSKDSLISYKYFIETGGREKDLKRLRKWFKEVEKNNQDENILVSSLEN